ncbi:hypothetical protein D3C79_805280 [compost metagenome]
MCPGKLVFDFADQLVHELAERSGFSGCQQVPEVVFPGSDMAQEASIVVSCAGHETALLGPGKVGIGHLHVAEEGAAQRLTLVAEVHHECTHLRMFDGACVEQCCREDGCPNKLCIGQVKRQTRALHIHQVIGQCLALQYIASGVMTNCQTLYLQQGGDHFLVRPQYVLCQALYQCSGGRAPRQGLECADCETGLMCGHGEACGHQAHFKHAHLTDVFFALCSEPCVIRPAQR